MTDVSSPGHPAFPSDGMTLRSVGSVDESSFGFTGLDAVGVGVSKLPGFDGSASPAPASSSVPAAGSATDALMGDAAFRQAYYSDDHLVRQPAVTRLHAAMQADASGQVQRASATAAPADGQIDDTLRQALASTDPHIKAAAEAAVRERQARAGADAQADGGDQVAQGSADAEPVSAFDVSRFGDADQGEVVEVVSIAREGGIPSSIWNEGSEMVARMGPDFVPDAALVERNYANVKASMPESEFRLGAAALKALVESHPVYDDAVDRLMSNPSTAVWTFKTAASLAAQLKG